MTTTYFACDSCGHEVSGYSKKDLLTEGWRWHDAGNDRTFAMCDSCGARFAPVWAAREAVASS